MTVDNETFLTSNKRDYKWPYAVPLSSIPAQPPIRTRKNNMYVAKLIEPYCHCDSHLYEPEMGRYKKLARKEVTLHKELEELSKKMAILASDILDHPCDNDDEKMETIYQIDFVKKGLPIAKYRKLKAAIDSPVGVPVKGEVFGLGEGYKDPTKFRFSTFLKPYIDVCSPVTYTRTPTLTDAWFEHKTGTSEYNDTFNWVGHNIIMNSQQYREPTPSSRRRADEPCKSQ